MLTSCHLWNWHKRHSAWASTSSTSTSRCSYHFTSCASNTCCWRREVAGGRLQIWRRRAKQIYLLNVCDPEISATPTCLYLPASIRKLINEFCDLCLWQTFVTLYRCNVAGLWQQSQQSILFSDEWLSQSCITRGVVWPHLQGIGSGVHPHISTSCTDLLLTRLHIV